MSVAQTLRVPAIEVSQGRNRTLYSFAIDGKLIPSFATVSRIHRNGTIQGYQRPEVLAHIDEIRAYLEGPSPMVPNAIVLALDKRVRFEPTDASPCQYARGGTLVIPVEGNTADADKPGFVVDGQQRLAAVRDADVRRFPLCVTAFIADSVREQTEQFILVNSTKPLSKGLIYELLPHTDTTLPHGLERRRFPALLLDRLNHTKGSPLYKTIQTPTTPEGLIKDNSILKMLENSLSDGVLYRLRGIGRAHDLQSMLTVLQSFWRAVRDVFSDAWGLPPKRSRLMHGAGIVSLGFLMDAIAENESRTLPSYELFRRELEPLLAICRWTGGSWDFGQGHSRKWNEIQNTSKDIALLANHLRLSYSKLSSVPRTEGPSRPPRRRRRK
ncbi:MAG TPA: DGQHR domain-containing protein DpdB [Fimbriimonas sp.]|nr:DGQHR domain-containing protein DpdB [Fimbriimonas sp.]